MLVILYHFIYHFSMPLNSIGVEQRREGYKCYLFTYLPSHGLIRETRYGLIDRNIEEISSTMLVFKELQQRMGHQIMQVS